MGADPVRDAGLGGDAARALAQLLERREALVADGEGRDPRDLLEPLKGAGDLGDFVLQQLDVHILDLHRHTQFRLSCKL
jgi:hypothetical protein